MKECRECCRVFRDGYNLRRHMLSHVNATREKPLYLCQVCGRNGRDPAGLKRHMLVHVSKDLRCNACRTVFASTEETEGHKRNCAKILTCFHCGKRLVERSALRSHIRRFHVAESLHTSAHEKRCPLCDSVFPTFEAIEGHFSQSHGIQLDKQIFSFNNELQFYEWKEQLENCTATYYSQYTTTRPNRRGWKKTIYQCHRVGKPPLPNAHRRKRSAKILGSNKINAYCPARMYVTFTPTGGAEVKCVTTHVGHDFVLGRVPLSRQLREEIAEKIAMNMSFDDILSSYQKEVEDGNVRRVHLLTRKDLHNIKRDSSKWNTLQSSHSSKSCTLVNTQTLPSEDEREPGKPSHQESDGSEHYGEMSTEENNFNDEQGNYICYVISETKDMVFHEVQKQSPVSRLREAIRESVNEVLDAVDETTDQETLEKVCEAVRKIRATLLS